MQIRGLEGLLGVRLLERTRRSVSVTEPGRLFLEEARRILRALDQAIDLAQRAERGEAGRLTVGYSVATAYSGLLSRLLGAFHRSTPDVALKTRELHPAVQREALLAGERDIGFVVRDAASQNPEFHSRIVERRAPAFRRRSRRGVKWSGAIEMTCSQPCVGGLPPSAGSRCRPTRGVSAVISS